MPVPVPRSYTQLEYDVALELRKPIFVLMTREDATAFPRAAESAEHKESQRAHRAALLQAAHQVWWFGDDAGAAALVIDAVPRLRELCGWRPIHYLHPPSVPAYFAGRQAELAQLSEALRTDSPAVIVVIGLPGQGKTTLVHEATRTERCGTFASAFWCTANRLGFTFDQFLDEALAHFTEGAFCKRDSPEPALRLRRLIEHLQRRPVLLVVDGAEQWLAEYGGDDSPRRGDAQSGRRSADPCFDELLAAATALANGSHLLLTSRALPSALDHQRHRAIPVRADSAQAALEGLEERAAVDMLRSLGARGEDAALAAAARAYGYHPLALRILAGLLDRDPDFIARPGFAAAALDPKEKLFAILSYAWTRVPRRTGAERMLCAAAHSLEEPSLRTLSSVLAPRWGWPGRLLRWMGRAIPGALRRSTQPAGEISKLRDCVHGLAPWRFVSWERNGDALHLHPVVAEFFRLRTRRRDHWHRAFARHYASQPVPANAASLRDAAARHLAVEHALAAGRQRWCGDLVFGPFLPGCCYSEWLAAWGHLAQGVDLLGRVARDAPKWLRADLQMARSAFLRDLGRCEEAIAAATVAIDTHKASGRSSRRATQGLIRALINRASALRIVGRSRDAVTDLDAALERTRGDRSRYGCEMLLGLLGRGSSLLDLGHWSRALADTGQAVSLAESIAGASPAAVPDHLPLALGNRAIVRAEMGSPEEALADFDAAIAAYGRLVSGGRRDLEVREAALKVARASTLRECGRLDDASRDLDGAAALLRTLSMGGRKDAESQYALASLGKAHVHLQRRAGPAALEEAVISAASYERLVADGREDLGGCLAHAIVVRGAARLACGEVDAARADIARGVDLLSLQMTAWEAESDIVIVYLQRVTAVVLQLITIDRDFACRLLDELLTHVEAILRDTRASEARTAHARRSLEALAGLAPAACASPLRDRIARLTAAAGTVSIGGESASVRGSPQEE